MTKEERKDYELENQIKYVTIEHILSEIRTMFHHGHIDKTSTDSNEFFKRMEIIDPDIASKHRLAMMYGYEEMIKSIEQYYMNLFMKMFDEIIFDNFNLDKLRELKWKKQQQS